MRVILMVERFCSQASRAEDEVKPPTYVLLNAMSLVGLAILDLWVAVTEPRPEDDERGAPGS